MRDGAVRKMRRAGVACRAGAWEERLGMLVSRAERVWRAEGLCRSGRRTCVAGDCFWRQVLGDVLDGSSNRCVAGALCWVLPLRGGCFVLGTILSTFLCEAIQCAQRL